VDCCLSELEQLLVVTWPGSRTVTSRWSGVVWCGVVCWSTLLISRWFARRLRLSSHSARRLCLHFATSLAPRVFITENESSVFIMWPRAARPAGRLVGLLGRRHLGLDCTEPVPRRSYCIVPRSRSVPCRSVLSHVGRPSVRGNVTKRLDAVYGVDYCLYPSSSALLDSARRSFLNRYVPR